ncbi:MAG: 2-polyprenyl-3-methyl-5-hydroxy-6-metoxy-1,4-benzoquinol methylase [Gammaproteobacteria bacterium]|jgi:2-polyprenyl-3-methyl-5-hydroxy-6-metoxy-1,4-benzoquinol methylase
MKRSAQLDYSDLHGDVYYEKNNRERKAFTIVSILDDFLGEKLKTSRILDVGASTGFIDNVLADHAGYVEGLDIDQKAVQFAKKNFKKDNLEFKESDALRLSYQDECFEIVICNHVYEHVVDDTQLMDEIFRVLTEDGICFFTAGNRLRLMEPHYHLPLLSVIPHAFAHMYLKIVGKGGYYHEKHRTYWGLKALVHRYKHKDYTREIVSNPQRYKAEYMIKQGSMKQAAAKFLCRYLYWACPTYIWILEKRNV